MGHGSKPAHQRIQLGRGDEYVKCKHYGGDMNCQLKKKRSKRCYSQTVHLGSHCFYRALECELHYKGVWFGGVLLCTTFIYCNDWILHILLVLYIFTNQSITVF